MSQVCKKIRVRGRVQGVFFRSFTEQHAKALKLSGWTCNEIDGSVSVFACGLEEQLNQLIELLRQGPVAARVDDLEVITADYEEWEDFVIMR